MYINFSRLVFSFATIASLVIALVSGCRNPEARRGPKGPTAVPVIVQSVKVDPVQRSVEIVGTLYGDEDATIAVKVAGKISAIFKDVGDRVRSDEPLAQIAPIDYELARRQKQLAAREPLAKLGLRELPQGEFDVTTLPAVRRAKLQADNAEAKRNRGRQLHDQTPPLISDQDYADLTTAWEVAKSNYDVEVLTAQSLLAQARSLAAEFEIADQRLNDATVRAPATQPSDGSRIRSFAVTSRTVSVGEFVREGAPMFRLVDDDNIKLRANVPERYIRDIQLGQEVHLSVEAYSEEFIGRVARLNPQVDPTNRSFQIEVLVPNPKHQLKAGAFVRGQVLTRFDSKAVFVPQNAIVSFAGINKVFTLKDNKAIENTVELGERRGDYVEVIRGLTGNELVVTEGASKLAEGVEARVKPPETRPATTTAPTAR